MDWEVTAQPTTFKIEGSELEMDASFEDIQDVLRGILGGVDAKVSLINENSHSLQPGEDAQPGTTYRVISTTTVAG